MSPDLETEAEAADVMWCCASCGTAAVDGINLKKCPDCDVVQYCSEICKLEHRPQHEAICKKRAAELRDEILFRQPESTHEGDCPICFLPLPLDAKKSRMTSCCSKAICKGCDYANELREIEERLQPTCPFCRHPVPKTQEENDANAMRRVAAKDPVAILQMGGKHYNEGDYDTAFEYWTKAAELGNVSANYQLSTMYHNAQGVEKDEKKKLFHLEEAAIGGHPTARYNLACHEERTNRIDRAVKHWIIASNLGYDLSIQALKECFKRGLVSKEDFAAALRAHQAAVDATKSPQRDFAAKNDKGG